MFGRSSDEPTVVEFLAFSHGLGKDSDESAAASFNGFVPARWEPGTELVLALTWSEELGVHRLTSSRLLGVLEGVLRLEPAEFPDARADETQRGGPVVPRIHLVEGAGHCGECHTPRDRFGGLIRERWLAGAPNPEGKGRIPNITPGGKNISEWSAADIAYYLESGFTPDFDTVGGSMVAVQENMAMLSAEDRTAIAAYLQALPALD